MRLPAEVPGRLFLSELPGRWAPLSESLAMMDAVGISRVVCLVPDHEIKRKSPEYFRAIRAGSFPYPVERLPIPDGWVPERSPLRALVERLISALRSGEAVLIHCAAGMGRTGTVAECLLLGLGMTSEDADAEVIQAGSCPESPQQEALIAWFAQVVRGASPWGDQAT